jgi:hypothetical protein
MESGGGWIDWRQCGVASGRNLAVHKAVFRMDHFQRRPRAADLAEATQAHAPLERSLLIGGEVEEPQHESAGTVAEISEQHAAAAAADLAQLNLAFDAGLVSRAQASDRKHAGAILVSDRQMEQKIANGVDFEARQAPGQPGANAFQPRDR